MLNAGIVEFTKTLLLRIDLTQEKMMQYLILKARKTNIFMGF